MPVPSLVTVLSRAFLAGQPAVEEIVARCTFVSGKPFRWLRPLARKYVKEFAGRARPRHRDVVQFIWRDPGFQRIWTKYQPRLSAAHWLTGPSQMQPALTAKTWPVPPIESTRDLADWLHITLGELEWYADLKGLGYKKSNGKLRHYHYRVLTKISGNIRLIEAPKSRLKELQSRVLSQILDKIPAHEAVHGFVKSRSIKTFAAPHVGSHIVLRMDLRDFFPSFARPRIQAMFRTMGYPESVADRLGGICTTTTPRDIWSRGAFGEDPLHLWESRWEARALHFQPHLPQGAPTSPALANLCGFRLDCRLSGLAKSAGANYTRYADDLAFSGDEEFAKRARRFSIHVAAIAMEEGFKMHHRKTRIMRQGVRQHLAGLVVNQRLNVARDDFDRLKAVLTNCVRFGPASQNRESHPQFRSHLEGRVGFVEMINPAKGKRLRGILERIQWS
jgi:retron-type reverse transcriptase